jgi:hypothetical protein
MRRKDTMTVGRNAEDFAAFLLKQRGFDVSNLNDEQTNYPLYDLAASKGAEKVKISVKCARATRNICLGKSHILERLDDDCVVMAFLPVSKHEEIKFEPGGYELFVIPGRIAREEALAAHRHYVASYPLCANHRVMIRDKIDRTEGTRSGALFKSWHERFLDAWDTIDAVLIRPGHAGSLMESSGI